MHLSGCWAVVTESSIKIEAEGVLVLQMWRLLLALILLVRLVVLILWDHWQVDAAE